MNILINLFSFKGSVSRKIYWLSIIAWLFAYMICAAFVFNTYDMDRRDIYYMDTFLKENEIRNFIFASFLIVMAISFFALQVKRCHDIGWSGWFALWSFVPYLNLVWWLMLGAMTKQNIQEAEDLRKEIEKEKEERRKQEKQEEENRQKREAEAIKRQQEIEDRIQKAEDSILSSGDPKAISLLLLARKMPTHYTQILAGGMKNGNSTLKKALAVMTGAVAGNLVATAVSVAAIQNALEDMQPEIQDALEDIQLDTDTMNFDSLDEIELPDEELVLDAESGSDFDLSDLFN